MNILDTVITHRTFSQRLTDFCSRFDVIAIVIPFSRFLDHSSRVDVIARATDLLTKFSKQLVYVMPTGNRFEVGKKTIGIEELSEITGNQRIGAVIPFNPHHEMDSFVVNIEACGVPLFDLTLGIIHASRVLQNADFASRGAIDACYALLNDRDSQEAFISLLAARRTGDASLIQMAAYEEYDHPLLRLDQQKLFADCGAFVGSTADMFLARSPNADVVSFEPSVGTFAQLEKNRSSHALSEHWKVENAAVDHQTGSGNFGGEGLGARIGAGDEQILIHSLDDYFDSNVPTLIKMDIEGSEIDAILGARNIIRKYKPALVICIYHLDDDLWKIPLLIASINSSYKFYLGHHGDILYETVVYAI